MSVPYLIRERRDDDFPALAAALYAQQPQTLYPLRNPLPIPVDTFLHRHDALAAWTVESEGHPAGHGCHVGPLSADSVAVELNEVCARAYSCATSELTWVSALFVATQLRGLGLGRQLLELIVSDATARGLRPCLEVYPAHPAAAGLYRRSGWQVVHETRPDWLREAKGDEGPNVLVMVLPDVVQGSSPS